MKKLTPVVFILIVAALIWPVNYFIYGMKRPNPDATALSRIVQDDAFLAGLQNKGIDGCVALKHMKDIEMIVIGSSHAYASIDLYALKSASDNKSVGICAMPAWNTDFLHAFMTFLDAEDISPKHIVWIADPAVPLQLSQNEKRLAYAMDVFENHVAHKKVTDKWVEKSQGNLPVFGLDMPAYKARNAFHKDRLNSLSLESVTQILRVQEPVAFGNLATVLETARINPLNKKNLRRFCTDLKLQGIGLDIVLSPVPQKVSKLVADTGPKSESNTLQEFLETHIRCARDITGQSLKEWGLDERHFMNRKLDDEYPYHVWENEDAFEAHYANVAQRTRPNFYSPDHLNPIGATIFSKKIGSLIGQKIK